MWSVSVVIFSRNRHQALAGAVARYARAGVPVIVADGSEEPLDASVAALCTHYVHLPDTGIYHRVHAGVERVNTPTVVLAADDDVMLPRTLGECASRILQGLGCVRACGTTVHIASKAPDLREAVPDLQVERVLDLGNPDDPIKRYLEVMHFSPQVFYAVVRTDVARAVAKVIRAIPNDSAFVGEQLWTALPALAGATVLVDRLQSVRRIPLSAPNYGEYQVGLKGIQSLSGWPLYGEIIDALRSVARELHLTPESAAYVADHFARNNWLMRVRPDVVASKRSFISWLKRGIVKYLRNPAAVARHSSRSVITGLANRPLVRCSAYPWTRGGEPADAILREALGM